MTAVNGELAERLRGPVQTVLAARVDVLRGSLPVFPAARYEWWRSLDADQARRAALLDRLEALHAHLDGLPALGYDAADPLPAAALEAAEGTGDVELDRLIAAYRAAAQASAA
ncbi:hypothetical protein ACGFYQ_33860 [Streptomyces sp. NPDC048258]|uniref:hypothetical protein n=1 Tax=Streptomyces sp. NPDC048258 TaxID=3365527 RepID=UPI003721DB9A